MTVASLCEQSTTSSVIQRNMCAHVGKYQPMARRN